MPVIMKNSCPRITLFLFSCALFLLISATSAFVVPVVSIEPALSKTESSSARFYTDEEESEWYTPPPKPKASTKKLAVPIETIVKSPEDLRSFLQDQEDGRLAIVTYHGAWCRSCARFNLHLNKLKFKYADDLVENKDKASSLLKKEKGKVRFASVEWGANTLLCQDQSVTKLPTTRLYYRGKLVKEFTKGAPEITRVQDAIKYYVSKQEKDTKQREFETALVKGTFQSHREPCRNVSTSCGDNILGVAIKQEFL